MCSLVTSTFYRALFLSVLVAFSLAVTDAQVRSSTNYQLQSDSINVGGGLSSSTNFVQESTVGEIATGNSTSSSYELYAGYQQMQEVFLSMTAAANVTMDTALPGITGGVSNGTTSVVVTTDSPSGYQLQISAANNPAMQGPGGSIPDYPATSSPDFSFTVSSGEAYFGFSPSGTDITQAFQDNTLVCGTGGSDTYRSCWAGLTTGIQIIASDTSANHPSGATTTIHFRTELGGGNSIPSGVYIATTTLTALPL